MRIRAAVLREMGRPTPYARSRPLELADVELDGPGPGELLLKIGAAGLCHSDLSVIDGSRPRPMPMVLGHEAAGTVVATGPGVRRFQAGDRVVVDAVASKLELAERIAGVTTLAATDDVVERIRRHRRWRRLRDRDRRQCRGPRAGLRRHATRRVHHRRRSPASRAHADDPGRQPRGGGADAERLIPRLNEGFDRLARGEAVRQAVVF